MKRFFLCLLLLLAAAPAAALEITFKKETAVTTDFVTFGDVAEFDEDSRLAEALASKVIARSPDPGESMLLNSVNIQKEILRKTRLSRYTLWNGSSVVAVARKGQEVTTETLLGAIDDYLQRKKQSLPEAEIRFKPRSLPLPLMLPKGQLDIEVVSSNPSLLKSSGFSLILRVDGKVEENFSIQGDLQALAEVVVVTDSLSRGTILSPANTATAVRDLTEHTQPCTDLRSILGKRVKHSLRAQSVLSVTDVEIPPLVRRGQLVKIVLNRGNMHITATGIARSDGKHGEIIRVQNASSNKLIHCMVAAPGIVEVRI